MMREYDNLDTDYDKYIKTEPLLSLQKDIDDLTNPDELCFIVTHQSMELWMKAAVYEVDKTRAALENNDFFFARRNLKRTALILKHLSHALWILESMSQSDYHEIRLALGRGSGSDSPGFNRLMGALPTLWEPYCLALERAGLSLDQVMEQPHYDPHVLAYEAGMALLGVDKEFQTFRYEHLQAAKRQIGLKVKSLKGVPAKALEQGVLKEFYPELWQAVERLTHKTTGDSY